MKTGKRMNFESSPEECREILSTIAKIGYDCVDFQPYMNKNHPIFGFSSAQLKQIAAYAEDAGIEICQAHGRWEWPFDHDTEAGRKDWYDSMAAAVRGCELIGCPRLVVHPVMPDAYREKRDTDRVEELNRDFLRKLCDYAAGFGVTVCLENMPFDALTLAKTEDILRIVKEVDAPNLKVCLDTGHSAVLGCSPAEDARLLGKEYLAALHVHDNDGKEDRHWNPFRGVIGWRDFSFALHEIGYEGAVSLETDVSCSTDTPAQVREALERGLFLSAKAIAENRFD